MEAGDVLRLRSTRQGPGESPLEDSVSAAAGLARLSSEASTLAKRLPTHSHPGPGALACPGRPEDAFSDFLYWRAPLPDISGDLELLRGEAGPQDADSSGHVARSEIQKVLDSLQEHMMGDPDVQAQVQVLSAALSAAQLDSADEPERQAAEVLSEASGSGPSAGDRRPAPPASAPQRERPTASAAGSANPSEPCSGTRDLAETQEQRHDPTPLEENKSKLQVRSLKSKTLHSFTSSRS